MPTLITGSVRSGTTLALRVLAPSLSPKEEVAPSTFNEAASLTSAIRSGDFDVAFAQLDENLQNRYGLVKSPHMGFLLPELTATARIVITFRDLRQVIASILRHPNARQFDINASYWHRWCPTRPPSDEFARAYYFSLSIYLRISEYAGPLEIWNYGFWDNWEMQSSQIGHLYSRTMETSPSVIADVQSGKVFSDASMTLNSWEVMCENLSISESQKTMVNEGIDMLKALYADRGTPVKTISDLGDAATLGLPETKKPDLKEASASLQE